MTEFKVAKIIFIFWNDNGCSVLPDHQTTITLGIPMSIAVTMAVIEVIIWVFQ
jgi:hypothetical protein